MRRAALPLRTHVPVPLTSLELLVPLDHLYVTSNTPRVLVACLLHDSSLLNTQFFVFFPRGSQALVAKKVKKENMAKR